MRRFCPLIPGGGTVTSQVTTLRVRMLAGRFNTGNREIDLTGRMAWALDRLIQAGARGCTPITEPAGPRWSGYVHRLRGVGLDIQTLTTPHTGPYAGHHAKYVLRTAVEVISDEMAAA